jgi:cathepsin C
MYEARLRIATNNTKKLVLSPQNIVSCCTYSQGCDGGLELLVSKYGEDFGFVREECEPYHAYGSKCSNKCQPGDVIHATNYSFVGGYYGGCSEQGMIDALLSGGPITIGFNVLDDFFHYTSGVYRHHLVQGHVNKFEVVNHAMLVVGYGQDGHGKSAVKYWIVKNSWGSGWGMSGYVKILRGVDECGVESEATYGHIAL